MYLRRRLWTELGGARRYEDYYFDSGARESLFGEYWVRPLALRSLWCLGFLRGRQCIGDRYIILDIDCPAGYKYATCRIS